MTKHDEIVRWLSNNLEKSSNGFTYIKIGYVNDKDYEQQKSDIAKAIEKIYSVKYLERKAIEELYDTFIDEMYLCFKEEFTYGKSVNNQKWYEKIADNFLSAILKLAIPETRAFTKRLIADKDEQIFVLKEEVDKLKDKIERIKG